MKKIEKRMHADKERVLDEVSCIDAATELGLMMKEKSGKVYLECPFHEKMIGKPDRHIGNCVISKDARRCYCYACNGSGDAIEMVMAVEGLSFCEATDLYIPLCFLLICLAVALLALFVIWVGSKVIQSIERKEKMKEIELEAYEQAGKRIKKQMEEKEE